MREDQLGRKSRHVAKRQKPVSKPAPWKLLLWTAIAGLIFGLIGFGEIAEDYLRASRNSLHWHKASGETVLVDIDDASLRALGGWPWPRQQYTQLVNVLTKAGAKRIFIDIFVDTRADAKSDREFVEALRRSGRVVLPALTRFGPNEASKRIDRIPPETFGRYADTGSVTIRYNYQNAVWRLFYSEPIQGKNIRTYSAILADRPASSADFLLDYSVDPASIPRIPAATVLGKSFDPKQVAGKDVVIGVTSAAGSDIVFVPGTGRLGGAYVHMIGAETLKAGTPREFGWVPLFLVSLALAAVATLRRSPLQQGVLLGSGIAGLLFGTAVLEANLLYFDITPGLFVLITVGTVLFWRRYRTRGLVNEVSNLPNLNALRMNKSGREQALIAARILNYEEIVASLPANTERQLIDQIVSRLLVGSTTRTLFQGDGGIFAWFEESKAPFGNHLDALHSLFRNPARVGELSIDLTISFGVEVGSGRSLSNRLASALVAAEEAAHDGLKWKYHDPDSLQDASWKLSILSQLDSAIDRGEVWVAYQPKLDLKTRRIIGAEALARWTHPEKGPIAASEFIAAAEQHDRIGKLTDFVLDKAVAAAASINKRGADFGIAVNLSARLLSDKGFTLRVSALLARHRLAPEHLTLELTETAALTDSGEGLEMIAGLRALGIRISIDDYGTGLSTLEYLKKIPANEIKIDQSFVKAMTDNRSDRLMVQSTIGLAHSLGRQVVAEGVEQSEILDALVEMGCDIAQGFAIGRPMSLESLTKRISGDRRRQVA
jgi:EAL domain-containing protein (putative c-di-GMP-specific phosphodiesterase class I)/CHASE2 domain-containing sensor protein